MCRLLVIFVLSMPVYAGSEVDDEGADTCTINAYFPKFKVTVINP